METHQPIPNPRIVITPVGENPGDGLYPMFTADVSGRVIIDNSGGDYPAGTTWWVWYLYPGGGLAGVHLPDWTITISGTLSAHLLVLFPMPSQAPE